MALYGTFKYGEELYGKQANLTETITINDVFSTLSVFLKGLLESITIVGALASMSISKVINNAVTIVSSFLSVGTFYKTISNTITIVGNAIVTQLKTITESISINDNL